jgi:hypothetical protein
MHLPLDPLSFHEKKSRNLSAMPANAVASVENNEWFGVPG